MKNFTIKWNTNPRIITVTNPNTVIKLADIGPFIPFVTNLIDNNKVTFNHCDNDDYFTIHAQDVVGHSSTGVGGVLYVRVIL